jgi:hypothetical protein
MNKSVITKDLIPFALWISFLIVSTIVLDYLLHQFQLAWIGKYFGILGLLILMLSFFYSLRKRKLIQFGSIKFLLSAHEYLAWFGTLLILVHGGIHFNGLLPWTALFFMLLVFISGMIGQYILKDARKTLKIKYTHLHEKGLSEEEIERKVFIDALTVKAMTQWRFIHKPITLIFSILAFIHIITIFMFWSWF